MTVPTKEMIDAWKITPFSGSAEAVVDCLVGLKVGALVRTRPHQVNVRLNSYVDAPTIQKALEYALPVGVVVKCVAGKFYHRHITGVAILHMRDAGWWKRWKGN